jgi:uncharacterized protein (TIGR02246 family)
MNRRLIFPSLVLVMVVGLGLANQQAPAQQQPQTNRKPACGCYVCGLLLAVQFPNKEPQCYGILAEDACPEQLSRLPEESRAAFCQQLRAKSKDKSLDTCPALKNACGVPAVVTGQTSASQASVAPRSPDEVAILENVKQMETGWNTKSGASFAKPFAADADYVIINGMHIRGYDAIEKGHQQIFDTIYKDTTVSLIVKQIRFLRPDVALVHVSGHRDSPQPNLKADATLVMVMTKNDGSWKIASFQNTPVSGPPPSNK